MLASIPEIVAKQIVATRPHLRMKKPPFKFTGSAGELLWPVATDDDEPCKFVRAKIIEIAKTLR